MQASNLGASVDGALPALTALLVFNGEWLSLVECTAAFEVIWILQLLHTELLNWRPLSSVLLICLIDLLYQYSKLIATLVLGFEGGGSHFAVHPDLGLIRHKRWFMRHFLVVNLFELLDRVRGLANALWFQLVVVKGLICTSCSTIYFGWAWYYYLVWQDMEACHHAHSVLGVHAWVWWFPHVLS